MLFKCCRNSKILLWVISCGFLSVNADANVRLPALISDGMVLQRNHVINLWGWAKPGEHIKITFNHKTRNVNTNGSGEWLVSYPAMKAGGPYMLEVNGLNHLVVKNILIGDVWFCSGQSNMVLPMERVKEKYPEEYYNDDYPQIRNFFIPTVSDIKREYDDLPASSWKAATKLNLANFGAASYFFARKLYQKYHVPIGIINSSVGGTPIEAWISKSGFNSLPLVQKRINDLLDTTYFNKTFKRTAAPQTTDKSVKDRGMLEKWFDTAYVATGWHKFWLPGYWADQGVKGLNGVVWFRKEITLPASMSGKPARLMLGRIVDADQTYVNGILVGNTTYQYPPRRYEVPAGLLKAGKNVITVRLTSTNGKGGFVPDKPYYLQAEGQTMDLRGDWLYKVGQVYTYDKYAMPSPVFSAQNEPTGLYNTMVNPVINYPVKGFVWYQGEANTAKPNEYQALLTALIADWRNKWGNTDLPFIFAQLPNFMEVQYSPSESQWAQLRTSQLRTLAVNNTAMTVNIDAGEWNDIHPLDKKDVGERLALAAEKLAYGEKDLVASGPIYQSAKIMGNKIEITFSSVGSGLSSKGDKELHYFAIAGADKKYVWANAKISGNTVIVWSDEIEHPLYVRYAWADNPEGANLYNAEGLPASPFTTDLQ